MKTSPQEPFYSTVTPSDSKKRTRTVSEVSKYTVNNLVIILTIFIIIVTLKSVHRNTPNVLVVDMVV